MKITFKISLFILTLTLFLFNQIARQKAYSAQAAPCTTLYGGGEVSDTKEFCTVENTPTPILLSQTPSPIKPPSQLAMVEKPPVLKQTPPTGPESTGIGILIASGILGYILRRRA